MNVTDILAVEPTLHTLIPIEEFKEWRDLTLFLSEYPVREIIAVFSMSNEQLGMCNWEIIEPELYRLLPDCETDLDIP